MEKKISVVIPNYNGQQILKKNLPNVIKYCPNCEILVIDDASTDASVSMLKKDFKKVKILTKSKNGGFSETVNLGVKKATGDLIMLLNSDVSPRQDLTPLAKYFEDENLFAVGVCDISHENGKKVLRGRGGAKFEKGFFKHFAKDTKPGKTMWVSGGSGLYDKQKFLNLGGFDCDYSPFYWEDIDLSYRAQKAGFEVLFDSAFQVDHYHEEGAIKNNRRQSYIKAISYRNQFLFVWKNISDYFLLIQHLIFLPYHITKSIIGKDWPFLIGLLKALQLLPKVIYNNRSSYYPPKLTDRQILKENEK